MDFATNAMGAAIGRWRGGDLGAGGTLAGLLAWLVAPASRSRRFEGVTVRRAVAPLVVFVALAAGWPLTGFGDGWVWTLGWSASPEATSRHGILQVVELMAGCAVIGCGVGEARSRAVEPLEGVLVALATMLGGALYWRQRRYVLALLGRVPVGPRGRVEPVRYGRIFPPPTADGAPK